MLSQENYIKNYKILEKIDETNYAEIFKVTDTKNNVIVLKLARTDAPNNNEIITREYTILAQIKHPNIVEVLDYDINVDGRAYFTLEYIKGKPINKYFNVFCEDFAVALIQVIDALNLLRSKGFVHSDLKPEHILFDTSSKRPVLIDFGFANIVGVEQQRGGTVGYLSPESIQGASVDQRNDVYSLGLTLYEILAGKQYTGSFLPLPNVTEDINRLLNRLVSTNPIIRPKMSELVEIISTHISSPKIGAYSYRPSLPYLCFVEVPGIVEKLNWFVGKTTLIYGDTGTGKTRLLHEMKYRFLSKGFRILHFSPTDNTNLFQSIRNLIGEELETGEHPDKFQVFEKMAQRIIEISKRKHLIIMIDDLHELSDYELALVRYVGSSIQDSNLSLVCTSKPNENVATLEFEKINLRPLTYEEVKTLLSTTFSSITHTTNRKRNLYTSDFAYWLRKESGGNPLFIHEILKMLFKDKVIQYAKDTWYVDVNLLGKTPIPRSIEDIIKLRFNETTSDELGILKVICLAECPLDIALINAICISDAESKIKRLKALDLVREDIENGHRIIDIASAAVVQSVRKLITAREKKSIYNNLATIVEKRNHERQDFLPIIAISCYEIGRKDDACEYYDRAASIATRMYDYESALKYYGRIIKYSKYKNRNKYFATLTKIADICQTTGEAQLSIGYYKRAIKAKSSHILAKAHTGLGKAYITMGRYSQAYKHLKEAINKVAYGTIEYILAANRLGYVLVNLLRFDDAEKLFKDSLYLARKNCNKEAEADTMYHLATIEWYRNNFSKGTGKAKELLIFCREHKLLKQYAFCSSLLGSLYQQMKNIPFAQSYFSEAIKIFTEIKRPDGLSAALHNSGLLMTQQGELNLAQRLFSKSLKIAERTNNKSIYLASIINSALICTDLGKYKKAMEFYKKALRIEPTNVWANYGLAMTHLQRNEADKAQAILLKRNREKVETLYTIGLALISSTNRSALRVNELSEEDLLRLSNNQSTDISMRVEVLVRAVQFYQTTNDSERVLFFSNKIHEITNPLSREHNIASALIKITRFDLKQKEDIDIESETTRLKEIDCLIDYAYLQKIRINSLINAGIEKLDVKKSVKELSRIKEILESRHADFMLKQLKDILYRLFPFVVEDYSRRVISEQYLQTFSGIAELISSNLGDEHFVQNILDLVIKATNAERGALFVKTTKGMDFIAGRDMDQTTIKDASALSHTAIKQMEKGKILFAQDALSDPAFNIKKSVMLNQIRSLLCIPLSVSGNVIGAIYLDSRITSGIFGPQDKDFLMTISKILASVIEKSLAFRSMSEENILLKANIIKEIGSGHLMGKSRVMKEIYRLIDSVAETNSPVLILGETGTGKGMIARLIHLRSQRKNKKFLSINCGTIPETLLESELFGHKKGAFTGAISDKKGLLEEGEGGTVFLDEITNTSLEFQGKLLEAIEEKIIRRVGETTTRNIDVRFLFATNKDLEIEVEDSRFRRDLFYRINVFKIEVPPLRDRANDIPLLAQFFLERYTKEMNKKIDGYAPEAMQRLREYLWPGNVRELQNVIERAVVLAKTNLINLGDIGFEKTKTAEVMPLKEIKKEAAAKLIREALRAHQGSVTLAAKTLGINRKTIQRYIKKFRIDK